MTNLSSTPTHAATHCPCRIQVTAKCNARLLHCSLRIYAEKPFLITCIFWTYDRRKSWWTALIPIFHSIPHSVLACSHRRLSIIEWRMSWRLQVMVAIRIFPRSISFSVVYPSVSRNPSSEFVIPCFFNNKKREIRGKGQKISGHTNMLIPFSRSRLRFAPGS